MSVALAGACERVLCPSLRWFAAAGLGVTLRGEQSGRGAHQVVKAHAPGLLVRRQNPAVGREGQIAGDGVVQRSLLEPVDEAGQAVAGHAHIRRPRRAVCFEHGEVPCRRDRAKGETRPGPPAQEGRRRCPESTVTGNERDAVTKLAMGRAAWQAVLGGQREGAGDQGIGCLQVGGCRVICQGLPCRGPRELEMRLRGDRPSRRSRKKRPPRIRMQVSAERPAVHIPAIAVDRPRQLDTKPGRQQRPCAAPVDGCGTRSCGPCHKGRRRGQLLPLDELSA